MFCDFVRISATITRPAVFSEVKLAGYCRCKKVQYGVDGSHACKSSTNRWAGSQFLQRITVSGPSRRVSTLVFLIHTFTNSHSTLAPLAITLASRAVQQYGRATEGEPRKSTDSTTSPPALRSSPAPGSARRTSSSAGPSSRPAS